MQSAQSERRRPKRRSGPGAGWHLAGNMVSLYFFGREVGHLFGAHPAAPDLLRSDQIESDRSGSDLFRPVRFAPGCRLLHPASSLKPLRLASCGLRIAFLHSASCSPHPAFRILHPASCVPHPASRILLRYGAPAAARPQPRAPVGASAGHSRCNASSELPPGLPGFRAAARGKPQPSLRAGPRRAARLSAQNRALRLSKERRPAAPRLSA